MRRIFAILGLLFIFISSQSILGQNRIYGGFGLGSAGEIQDSNFSINSNSIGYNDITYSTVSFPILAFEIQNASYRLESGINSISGSYNEESTLWLSPTQKELTNYEVTTTNFYIDYMIKQPIFPSTYGQLFGGLTFVESELIKVVEIYNVRDDGSGGSEDVFKSVEKEFNIDYGFGVTFGIGFSWTIFQSYEVGSQIRTFYRETNLSLPDGSTLKAGSTQFQFLFLTYFD